MKKRRILLIIILLAIGFATVSTTLIINGNVGLGFDSTDFDVYFSDATLNGEDKKSEFISSDGKKLNFNTNLLSIVGDQAVVYYEVTNASRIYDAEVKLVCDDFENEFVSVTNVLNGDTIKAQESTDGVIIAELVKASIETQSIDITCRIEATPTSREDVAEDPLDTEVTTYSLYGYYVDENDEPITNANLVIYSNEPHYTKTDNRGYFYVGGLEKGSHEIYYLGEIDNIQDLTKDEVKKLANTSSNFTTSSGSVVFKDNSQIKDVIIELTRKNSYDITLKTTTGIVITDKYQVTQNKPYGSLPNVEVKNASFIGWKLENGTLIDENTLVANDKTHVLIAVMSSVLAPTIEANNTNWTDKDVTISVKTAGVAEKGIKHYEYLVTNKENPNSEEKPTGTTNGNMTINNVGSNYVYYRTVANDDIKSSWSNGVNVKIDKSAPINVNFSNKVITNSNVTMNVNYVENESSITTTKCYYGDANSQTTNGTSSNGTCVYPATAEYAKVCVTNAVGKEACSSSKKLADYFIKNGIPQVEFEEYTPKDGVIKTTQKDGYYQVEVGEKETACGRGGIYTKNKYDLSDKAWGFFDFEFEELFLSGTPTFESNISDEIWFATVPTWQNLLHIEYKGTIEDKGKTISFARKTYSKELTLSPRNSVYLTMGKNSSGAYETVKIYNVWYQLTD